MTNQDLTVQLLDGQGEPLRIPGVLLDIRFYVGGQFRYSFPLGQTDAEGVCSTSFESIERQLEANRRLFLMDYNTPLRDCDRTVGVAVPTGAELKERASARAKWWPETIGPGNASANDLLRCPEQKFELQRGSGKLF
jgi:hypothetical protein